MPSFSDVDSALRGTLSSALGRGYVVGKASDPLGQHELLAYQFTITRPRARVTVSPDRPLNIISAVARFIWMIAANDRLADIAFYEPKVAGYTDDGLLVPGSSYGRRMFQARPGLNQVAGVVERLRADPTTRRAATVIWSPEDAVRSSHDIPCAFGTFYHVRDGGLTATTVMRSNNAFLLLPFNVFEFSLLAEVVAAEVGAEFREYVHWAASMHVLNRESDRAQRLITAPPAESYEMPPMPSEPSPLEQARELAKYEARLRTARTKGELTAIRSESRDSLAAYWQGLLDVLVVHHLAQIGSYDEALGIAESLPDYFAPGVTAGLAATRRVAESMSGDAGQASLFSELLNEPLPVDAPPLERYVQDLSSAADELEADGTVLSRSEYAEALLLLTQSEFRLAARSDSGRSPGPADAIVTSEELKELVARLRHSRRAPTSGG